MLLFLDHSLLANLNANTSPFSPTVIAVELAAEAARQGHHVLCGEIRTFDSLLKLDTLLSKRTLMLLNRARTKSIFRQGLIESVVWFTRITNTVNQPSIQSNSIGQTEILLPPTNIATKGTLLNKTKFIPENDNDGYFYEALTHRLIELDPKTRLAFTGVLLKYDLSQGGGQTTSNVYANTKLAKDNFCLAVVDSDQTYPNGPMGGTAKALLAVDSPPNSIEWNARSLVLTVRAVENTFPKSVLISTAKALDDFLGICAENIVALHATKPHWMFLPLKKGVKCFEVKNKSNPEEVFLSNATGFKRCPNTTTMPCTNKQDCETYLVPSLGTNLLAKICSAKPIQIIFNPELDSDLSQLLKDLCLEMISAFCGDEPVLGT